MQTTTNESTQQPKAKLIAFHGKPEIKAKYLARIRKHRAADELVRGMGWEPYNGPDENGEQKGRGCAIGCSLNSYDHDAYETELGIPVILAYLEDHIFESLPVDRAMEWPEQFLDAIPVSADLSKIAAQICIWQFEDPTYGLADTTEVEDNAELRQVCLDLVALFKREMGGGAVSRDEYSAIENRARARATTWARARATTWAGAWAWAWAETWATTWARATTWATTWARATTWAVAPYPILADKVLELLRNAPTAC